MNYSIAVAAAVAIVLAACADPASESGTTLAAGAAASPAQACASPESNGANAPDIGNPPIDFRGNWVLNTDRGANLGMMKAVKETIVATQSADSVTLDMTAVFAGMTTKRTVIYDFEGATMPNKAAMGADSETMSRWVGNTLVTIWTAEGAIAGTTSERTETRCLTDGGKTLNVVMTRAGNPDINNAIWFVYEKP